MDHHKIAQIHKFVFVCRKQAIDTFMTSNAQTPITNDDSASAIQARFATDYSAKERQQQHQQEANHIDQCMFTTYDTSFSVYFIFMNTGIALIMFQSLVVASHALKKCCFHKLVMLSQVVTN